MKALVEFSIEISEQFAPEGYALLYQLEPFKEAKSWGIGGRLHVLKELASAW